MPWGRLDDRGNRNSKLLALSDPAWRMWGCGLIYCQDELTDGFIPEAAIFTFGVKAKNKTAIADELCRSLVPGKSPLWHKVEGGFQVHDYLDWNDSREKVMADRARSKARVEKFRNGGRSANGSAKSNKPVTPLPTTDPLPLPLPQVLENPPDSQPDARKPHPIRELLSLHQSLFFKRFNQKPAKYTQADAAIAGSVIQHHGEVEARDLLTRFMASNEPFIVKAGFGINVFKSQINKLLTERAPAAAKPDPESDIAHRRTQERLYGAAK